ncbi:MAG: DUF2835 domain-containing protein [Thermodesulfobacteriota bacterium]|nr:DUF2835 domain-containing protein [Thermodesulfobacteriota bacterium]
MNQIIFSIKISSKEYLKFYQGSASWVNIVAEDGRHLRLPAKHLRPFLTHNGIAGRFILKFDDNNAMIALERL